MRDKLIELIDNNKACPYDFPCKECTYNDEPSCFSPRLADALIANGVTIAKDNNVLTNGDRIRAMTDDEIAKFLCNNTECGSCRFGNWTGCGVREWLKQPAKEEE